MAEVVEPLGTADFPAFYQAVHQYGPFPWQEALVAEVLANRRWPDLVDVPTGLGKTSMLDVAVFVAAATAHVPGVQRLGRRRCFFVVDRRIIVDEAYDHARALADAVTSAAGRDDVLGRVATALRSYAPDARGELLPVTRMRGGTTWAAAWLDRPDRPGIVLGTVDQVGSRLLFRGYGVSDRRRSIDAALVGTDALVLVDEAHLATALIKTVSAAQDRDELGIPLPGLSLVQLSATGTPTSNTFIFDVDAHRPHPIAGRRLTAAKRLTTRQATPKTCGKVLVDTVVEHLGALAKVADTAEAPTALVVCNTVDRARLVHTQLHKALAARGFVEAECVLLVGRTRPLDRPTVQREVLDRFGTGRHPSSRPAVLVATQTVEVGVNLDADILVSESTSWDALVQRLGRLNRLGKFTERFPGRPAAAAVVVHDGQDTDPIYGAARDATWQTLHAMVTDAIDKSADGIDVSPLACRRLTATVLAGEEFVRRPNDVPVLLGPTLDAWTQTAPVPLADPPVAPFLHGFDGGTAGVQVLWRDGLVSSDPLDDLFGDDDAELPDKQVDALLTQWPPRSAEMAEVPFIAVRQWMNGQTPDPVADVEAVPGVDGRALPGRDPFQVLVERVETTVRAEKDPQRWRWIDATQLRPGDQIVVPVERGGLDAYGWAPADDSPVRDVSEAATFVASRSRRAAALRLDGDLPSRLGLTDPDVATARTLIVNLIDRDDTPITPEDINALGETLAGLLPPEPPTLSGWIPDTWSSLRRWLSGGHLKIVEVGNPAEAAVVGGGEPEPWTRLLTGPRPPDADANAGNGGLMLDSDDEEVAASSVGTRRVTLAIHHAAVRTRAAEIAKALDLPPELRIVVEDAAGWHDLGKIEPRFQVMLHSGDPVEAALAPEPLAKSGMDPTDRLAWRRAARLSKLPSGARHEQWSATLIEEYLRRADVAYPGDSDLLIHLVASHHGYARPLARLVIDPDPATVEAVIDGEKIAVTSERTVSLDHPARFARLNHRYGRWGLALLETVIRCADMTVSGEGS